MMKTGSLCKTGNILWSDFIFKRWLWIINQLFSFWKTWLSLFRFTIETKSQEELDFVWQNVPSEIDFLEISMVLIFGRYPRCTRFPDICRLTKLQTLHFKNKFRFPQFQKLGFLLKWYHGLLLVNGFHLSNKYIPDPWQRRRDWNLFTKRIQYAKKTVVLNRWRSDRMTETQPDSPTMRED